MLTTFVGSIIPVFSRSLSIAIPLWVDAMSMAVSATAGKETVSSE